MFYFYAFLKPDRDRAFFVGKHAIAEASFPGGLTAIAFISS
ncbi:hypothetical protein [Oxynema aestuarii]|nr:hypothetical protein [Oxynema aestuarii]